MKISQLSKVLDVAWEIKRPVWIHSLPGLGKSTEIKGWSFRKGAEIKQEMGFIDFRVSQKSPNEIGPVLYVKDNLSLFTEPGWVPTDGYGVILLDEMSDAPPMVQSAMYEFILDRKMGDRKLGDNWLIVLAGNRQEDKAAAGRPSTALNNRCIHVTIEPDVEDLRVFAYQNNWNDAIPGFLSHRPNLVCTFDPKNKDFAFATPRTWEIVSEILNANPDQSVRFDLLAGTIGAGPASELEGFLRVRDELPNLQRILKNPDKEAVPTSPAAKWAVCGALANLADNSNLGDILIYVDRMADDNKSMFIRDILKKDNKLMHNRDYIKWIASNSEIYVDDVFGQ